MKIIPQSFEIIEPKNIVDQIADASGICYKTKPKNGNTKLLNKIITKKHNSCLEFAVVHLDILWESIEELIILLESNYITVTEASAERALCTASIRGWREFIIKHSDTDLAKSILSFLSNRLQMILFGDIMLGKQTRRPHCIEFFNPYSLINERAMEHIYAMVKFVTNRAVTHELVRHRPDSYLQESQRYCRYDADKFGNEVTFIKPEPFYEEGSDEYNIWYESCKSMELNYLKLLKTSSPQAARTVLPNSCKTEIIVYTSLKQWEHIFAMRTEKGVVEPSMYVAMKPVLDHFRIKYPCYFDNLKRSIG